MLADVLSPRYANDKLRRPEVAEPSAGFDLAAADALEVDYPVTTLRRLLVFANPKAGLRQAEEILGRVSQLLRIEKISLDVHHASTADDLTAAARGASLQGVDGVIVLGGDGTLNAVVHGLLSRPKSDPSTPPPPIALLPCGTGNALAYDLGFPDADTGLKHLLAGVTRPLDVMALSCGDRSFHAVAMVGWGLPADVAGRARSLKKLGRRSHEMAMRFETMRSRPRYARLEVVFSGRSGETVQGAFTMVLLANTQHTGHGMRVAPRARLDDGLIDLVEVLPVSLGKRLKTVQGFKDGSHLDSPAVRWRAVRGVTLSQPSKEQLFSESVLAGAGSKGDLKAKAGRQEPLRINIDGDIVELPAGSEVSISVLPRALRVFAPKPQAQGKK